MSKKTDQTLNKCDELINRLTELKKALSGEVNAQPARSPVSALGVGWSQDPSTGSFHHSTHGVISTIKHPQGFYQIVHGGRPVGRVANIADAGMKIKNYVKTLMPKDTGMQNVNPMAIAKSENLTPAQRAAAEEASKLRKSAEGQAWVRHSEVPNADEEVQKLDKHAPQKAEDMMANQLASVMAGRAMLGIQPPPQLNNRDFIKAGEAMGIAPSDDQLSKAEQEWNNRFNWLAEAQKPISARFNSPEEEQAYWDSLKIGGSGKDDFGF